MFRKAILPLFFCCSLGVRVPGQLAPAAIERFISLPANLQTLSLFDGNATRDFYRCQLCTPVWTVDRTLTLDLLQLLSRAAALGLEEKDYQFGLIRDYRAGNLVLSTEEDSIRAELRLTDAALHFAHDVIYGNRPPELDNAGPGYPTPCIDVSAVLQNAIGTRNLPAIADYNKEKFTEYARLLHYVAQFQETVSAPGFNEVIITSNAVNSGNTALVQKLQQLGIIDQVAKTPLTDSVLKSRVKDAQAFLGLLADGVLRASSIEAFNVPLASRLDELRSSLNTVRWLNCARNTRKTVIVNIPSATLLFYDGPRMVLESRVVVGKPGTVTPTLSSEITEVILYPYWSVPRSIAVKELLPRIRRNPSWLATNNYQVIDSRGRIVDPSKVNWAGMSAGNFPYSLRQSSGCDNALGLIKLNFSNPFSVYLHDTPYKLLFGMNRRYFSHGCMRVERAREIAQYLLRPNTGPIDSLSEKSALSHRSPETYPVEDPARVFVLYQTAWFNSDGSVFFSEDVYRRNKMMLAGR